MLAGGEGAVSLDGTILDEAVSKSALGLLARTRASSYR